MRVLLVLLAICSIALAETCSSLTCPVGWCWAGGSGSWFDANWCNGTSGVPTTLPFSQYKGSQYEDNYYYYDAIHAITIASGAVDLDNNGTFNTYVELYPGVAFNLLGGSLTISAYEVEFNGPSVIASDATLTITNGTHGTETGVYVYFESSSLAINGTLLVNYVDAEFQTYGELITINGAVNVVAGYVYFDEGAITFTAGSTVAASGRDSYVACYEGVVTIQSGSSFTISSDAELEFGYGTFTLESGATITINDQNTEFYLDDTAPFNIYGTINFNPGSEWYIDGGTVNIESGGVVNLFTSVTNTTRFSDSSAATVTTLAGGTLNIQTNVTESFRSSGTNFFKCDNTYCTATGSCCPHGCATGSQGGCTAGPTPTTPPPPTSTSVAALTSSIASSVASTAAASGGATATTSAAAVVTSAEASVAAITSTTATGAASSLPVLLSALFAVAIAVACL